MSHFIETCKFCKTVISQCRCPDKNKVKKEGVCKDCEGIEDSDDTCASCGSHDCECDHQQEIRDRDKKIEQLTTNQKALSKKWWDLVDDLNDWRTLFQNEHQLSDELVRELKINPCVCRCGKDYKCGLCTVISKHTEMRKQMDKPKPAPDPGTEGCELF